MTAPQLFRWDGEAMIPLSAKAADREYVIGEVYRLEHREDRSSQSHAHYFAALTEAWRNLPEGVSDKFLSVEALRKYALIMTGFRDERSFVASSKAQAERLAAFLRPSDDHAVIGIAGATVVVLTAKSQSMRAMGKAEFQRSKDAVLDFVAALIGATPGELSRSTGMAA